MQVASLENCIDILVPVARTTYLSKLLSSVRAQTSSAWRLLLQLDGLSAAQACEVDRVVEAVGLGAQVSIERNAVSRGANGATHQLIVRSSSPYFMIVDDDDELAADQVQACLERLQEIPSAAAVRTDKAYIDELGRLTTRTHKLEPRLRFRGLTLDLLNVGQALIISRRHYDLTAGWMTSSDHLGVGGDIDMAVRLEEVGEIVLLPRKLYRKRHHAENLSLQVSEAVLDPILSEIVSGMIARRMPHEPLDDRLVDALVHLAKVLELRESGGAGPRRPAATEPVSTSTGAQIHEIL